MTEKTEPLEQSFNPAEVEIKCTQVTHRLILTFNYSEVSWLSWQIYSNISSLLRHPSQHWQQPLFMSMMYVVSGPIFAFYAVSPWICPHAIKPFLPLLYFADVTCVRKSIRPFPCPHDCNVHVWERENLGMRVVILPVLILCMYQSHSQHVNMHEQSANQNSYLIIFSSHEESMA